MAILAHFLMVLVLPAMALAADDCGFLFCGNYHGDVDSSVSYSTPLDIATLSTKVLVGGPFTLIAGSERVEAQKYSCITLVQDVPLLPAFKLKYYLDGKAESVALNWDPFTGLFKGKLPEALLNSANANDEVSFTIVSYKDGFMVLKTCRPGFFVHYTATYTLADKTVTTATLDRTCVVDQIKSIFRTSSGWKGLCPTI